MNDELLKEAGGGNYFDELFKEAHYMGQLVTLIIQP